MNYCSLFLRYIYRNLLSHDPGTEHSLFEKISTKTKNRRRLKLKSDVTLHMYISTAPCGDAAISSR